MTTPAVPSRARRGRLLIVGREPSVDRLEDRLHQPPARTGNLFEAIGEMATAATGGPIAAVLVCDDTGAAAGRAATDALRQIDPSVPLVRIAASGGPEPAGLDGFDHHLTAPVEAKALIATVGPGLFRDAPAEPEPATGGPPATSPDAPGAGAAEAPSPAPTTEADDLGDTDLVTAVMTAPHGVRDTALALVRQHTGWTDVDLLDSGEAPPAEAACVAVDEDEPEGLRLVTSMAAAKQVAPWARWLGRWLALDASYREYRRMAYRDELTGAWNRRYFDDFLGRIIGEAAARRRPVTVMVFDLDDFKRFNDEFGHAAGDVILCETVTLLNSVIRRCDRVCRIGGDEFAVIFADLENPREAGSRHPDSVEAIARRFQAQVCTMRFAKLGLQAPGNLSISAGLATYPWDGQDAQTLLRLADERALASKRRGKNHITFGPDAGDLSAP